MCESIFSVSFLTLLWVATNPSFQVSTHHPSQDMLQTDTAEATTAGLGGNANATGEANATAVTNNRKEEEAKTKTTTKEGDGCIQPPPGPLKAVATAVERGPLDQTSRKVVVHNVLKFLRPKEVTRLVADWVRGRETTLQIVQTKKPPRDNWVKVTLADEKMVGPFIELINRGGEDGAALKNQRGGALFAKRADDFLRRDDGGSGRKRKGRDDDGRDGGHEGRSVRPRPVTVLSADEVRDKITPLWRLPYTDQLEKKAREMVTKCAMKIVKDVKKKFS